MADTVRVFSTLALKGAVDRLAAQYEAEVAPVLRDAGLEP
jgi:hypothetical protein